MVVTLSGMGETFRAESKKWRETMRLTTTTNVSVDGVMQG
jgi:hypothetical protein